MGGFEYGPADGPLPDRRDQQPDPGSFGPSPADDFDLDGHFAWLVGEIEAGRRQPPPESATDGPVASISLGDACEVDPQLLAAMCGPGGLGGQAVSAAFGQDEAADVLRPGPVLAALTAQTAADPASLTDDQLIGALQAARRLAKHADYQQTIVIAEYARRRQAQFEAAKAAGKPAGCRDGEFPGEELAMELVETSCWTRRRPRRFCGPRPGIREHAGALPSRLLTAPPSPTPAPRGSTPGNRPARRAANSAEIPAAHRHHGRQPS